MRKTVLFMMVAVGLALGADLAVELESAIRRETVQGDLKGAAEAYRKIAAEAGANREVAARALLRLGLVYRKQGDAQARQTLERLVRNYGDQKQVVAEARAELAHMGNGNGKAMVARQLWKASMDGGRPWADPQGISRDGRLVSVLHVKTGNVGVLDPGNGELRILTQYGNWDRLRGIVYETRISPDGRWVAHDARTRQGHELRIVATVGGEPKTLFRSEERGWISPYGWTADSRHILCVVDTRVSEPGEPYKARTDVVLISVPDGEMRKVKQDAGLQGGGLSMSISPDGRWIGYSTRNTQVRALSMDGSVENQITGGPDNDTMLGWSSDGKYLLFSSDRSGSNGIYRVAVRDGEASGAPELVRLMSGTPSPVGMDGKGTLHYSEGQFATDAYTVSLDIKNGRFTSEPMRVTKRFEGRNAAPLWSPDGSKLAWFSLRDHTHLADLFIRDLSSGDERELAMQVPTRWRIYPSWHADGDSLLLSTSEGRDPTTTTLHRIDTGTGAATVLKDDPRIVSWSDDGSRLYFLDRADRYRSISMWDASSGTEKVLFKDPAASYVREITPSPDGSQIAFVAHQDSSEDSGEFYGPVHIKILDVASGQARELVKVRPAWYGRMMTWAPDGKYLIYSTEWYAGRPDEPTRLWIVPASGGTPKQLGDQFQGRVFGLRVSPDGKQLAFDVTEHSRELWALENFLME